MPVLELERSTRGQETIAPELGGAQAKEGAYRIANRKAGSLGKFSCASDWEPPPELMQETF